MNNKKIGIIGGTFDPIHNGHLMIAQAAYNEYQLSKVIFIPTGISYMKTGVTDSYFRYNMTKLAIKKYPFFKISDIEITREGNTYTCDTIAYFKNKYPTDVLYFIIGTDSLFSIEKWKNVSYIFENCVILCATREVDKSDDNQIQMQQDKAKELSQKYNAKISFIHCPTLDISSTEIRTFRKENPNENLSTLELPSSVAKYIIRHDLYSQKTEDIHNRLKNQLKPKRFQHTMGVVDTAVRLAKKWGCDLQEARLAALLHDCAKHVDNDSKQAICAKYGVKINNVEVLNPELLHAKAGALKAFEEYNIHNESILSAIYYHTTGRPDMSLLEQIIFVADYIEPGRKHSKKLPKYHKMAKKDLNMVTACILNDTVAYLDEQAQNNHVIDPLTKETYEFYKKYL